MKVTITTDHAVYRRTVTSSKELLELVKFLDALSIEDSGYRIE